MSWPDHLTSAALYHVIVVDRLQANGVDLKAAFFHRELTVYIDRSVITHCLVGLGERSSLLSDNRDRSYIAR